MLSYSGLRHVCEAHDGCGSSIFTSSNIHYYNNDFLVRVESVFACGASTCLERAVCENPIFFRMGDKPARKNRDFRVRALKPPARENKKPKKIKIHPQTLI
jgi:hypothetical protein